MNALRRVEAQTVEMKLVDPVGGILREKLAHAFRCEVDFLPPFVVSIRKKTPCKFFPVTAVGAEMVVDDVKDDAESLRMGRVDEEAEIIGRAVQTRRSPQVDAVVTPAKSAGKIIDRHDLQNVDPEFRKRRKLFRRGAPRSFARERADVHFVDDAAIGHLPRGLPPAIRIWIDHLRWAMRTFRLKARRGIGKGFLRTVEPEPIARSRARLRDHTAKIAPAVCVERNVRSVDHNADVFAIGCPDAKAHSAADDLCADRAPALHGAHVRKGTAN